MLERILTETIRQGRLAVRFPDGHTVHYGQKGPEAEWLIRDPDVPRRLIKDPTFELGQTYMEGGWDAPQGLAGLIETLMRNVPDDNTLSFPGRIKRRLRQVNTVRASRAHIHQHYDLDEALFRSFLDRDMHYSCAYFADPGMSLEEAQRAKCEYLLRKLELRKGQRVLDIGSGWGGLAMYLAQHADVEVVGLTLSEEQHRVATQRARDRGLGGQVRFLLEDYREHGGTYDRIVSVGMFEHVGVPNYGTFFGCVGKRLGPRGLAVIHHIGRTGPPGLTNPWIERYIFPGGYNPALSEVVPPAEKAGLKLTDVEVLRFHYRYTLREWLRRFQIRRNEAVERFGEQFARMWEFYLASCEASFAVGDLVVYQLQMAMSLEGLPLTRAHWYRDREAIGSAAIQTA